MTHVADQFRSKATPTMVGMNVDLFEMDCAGLDHLNVRETHWRVVGEGDPSMSLALSLFQHLQSRRLVQDGLGGRVLRGDARLPARSLAAVRDLPGGLS